MKTKRNELLELLQPFVKEHEEKKNSVSEENVDDLIDFAEFGGVEDALIDYIKENPNASFWDFLHLIPDGLDDGADEDDDDA